VKCLIWDFDGTLAYHERGLWSGSMLHCLEQAAPEARVLREDLRPHLQTGFPWHSPETTHPELDTPQKWWNALFPVLERAYAAAGVSPELARELPARVREDFVDPARWHVFPDVLPVLDELSSRGWVHLVLSNHVPELSSIAGSLGLGNRIRRVFNSAQTRYEKPHPKAFRGALDVAKGAEEVWMTGDSAYADVAGARALGIPAVLVRRWRAGVEPYADDLYGVVAIVDG
jgi:putative hydrolase of the HAD superfamily